MFVLCIAGLCIENKHFALGFVNVFITNAAPTCFGTYHYPLSVVLLYQFTCCILLLLPASIPRFYYFIHPLYTLDMTDSVLLCYLLIASIWL
jgi:hypothetical protein